MSAPHPFRAGAVGVGLQPAERLPLLGLVREDDRGRTGLEPLEVTAAAFESGGTRTILCGIDAIGIQAPEVAALRRRVADATGAAVEGVLLNCSHTHQAPPAHMGLYERIIVDRSAAAAVAAYVRHVHDAVVAACRLACERLEPATLRWGLGHADVAVNRREIGDDGRWLRTGWNPDGPVDASVPCLQALRPDESPIVTVVGFGCHPLCTPAQETRYSPDYPGPLRAFVRTAVGGECVFLQGAGGNVMPRIAYEPTGAARAAMGRRLGIEAVHALAVRPPRPQRLTAATSLQGALVNVYRFEPDSSAPTPVVAIAEEEVAFPLHRQLTADMLDERLAAAEAAEQRAREQGATERDVASMQVFGGSHWLRWMRDNAEGEAFSTLVRAPVTCVRIGDGAIVTGPGEVFSETGMAIKERSPADVTLYAGCTNGLIAYLPSAAEHARGGYEVEESPSTFGLAGPLDAIAEELLVRTAVRLLRQVFPERRRDAPSGWTATGALPVPPSVEALERPAVEPAAVGAGR